MFQGTHRPMKYPYTLTAKIAQFPFKYYMQHSWLFKYLLISTFVTIPIFYKIQKLSYSPANVEKWDKIHREMFYGPPDGHH
ncbi:PREDICTED: uncharacterized protein LOC108778780 [Cyphomyrmex costatus]|uniref:Uncharacterized protein n=1 Tax=Cyphomyrmex costatus TaxID=456900 RepID=A0A195C8I4_9HYME|nr:PREDICTED: uncharacterized protein LOC108778780 [Cyphomyrmex costatus]KYM97132.1 hypothetical protein ALC62_12240 [Cyphomyrmex costatus]